MKLRNWLDQARNIRIPPAGSLFIWAQGKRTMLVMMLALAGIGGGLFIIETSMPRHAKFVIETVPGFYAIFGFSVFSLLVLSGWVTGRLLKRPENYYREQEPKPEKPDHDD